MAEVPVEEIPEPIPKRSDIAKGVRTVYLNRVAHMGMMLEKVNRQNRRVERLEKFAATGDVKDLDAPEDEDDMGVNIGNETHYHITETHNTQPPSESPLKSVVAKCAPYVAGPLLGAAGVVAWQWYTSKPTAPAPVVVGSDTDWKLGVNVKDSP